MGRALSREVKTVIYNVAKFFKDRKADKESFEHKNDVNIAKLVAEATGYCVKSVKNVMKEGNSSTEKYGRPKLNAPKKPKTIKKKINADTIDLGLIRRNIHQIYEFEKKVPSVRALITSLKQDGILNCGHEYLRKLLHTMGYRFKKCKSTRRLLIERPNITTWRKEYLTVIREYRTQNRNIYFLDETYINVSQGQRLVILHAGCREGLVDGALSIFQLDTNTVNCYGDINGPTFYEWIHENLKDKLLPNSIVVMDNAAHHNVPVERNPTIMSPRSEMQNWLQKNSVEFSDTMTKAQLQILINITKKGPVYRIDELLKEYGHTVLRIPPQHPELNPIKLVWSDIKNSIVESDNESQEEKINLLNVLFTNYTTEKWERCYNHVQKIEDEYWDRDGRFDNIIEPLLNDLQNDFETSSESETDDEINEEPMSE